MKIFPVLISSPDTRMYFDTFMRLKEISDELKKVLYFYVGRAGGVVAGRNQSFENARKALGTGIIRGLIIDDDIIIDDMPDKIAYEIAKADRENYNIIAPYAVVKGKEHLNHYIVKEGNVERLMSIDETLKLPKYAPVYAGGLGFYYGDVYLDYHFHADYAKGEDEYFFLDNHLTPLHVPIKLSHVKGIPVPIYD